MEGRVGRMTSWCCEKLVSSVFDNVLRVLFFLLFQSQIFFAAVSRVFCLFLGLSFFIFRKLIQVVFPSLGWSACFPLSSCRDDKTWVSLSGSSGPSVWALGGNPQGLSPFQSPLCFDPVRDVVCQHFFISLSRASFHLLNPIF